MSHRVGTPVVLAVFAAASLVAVAGDSRPKAREGFQLLLAATTPDGAPAHPESWPAALVERRDWRGTPEQLAEWRRKGIARLAAGKVAKVQESGTEALVRLRLADGEAQVPLHWDGTRWALAAPMEWLTKGKALDAANGRRAASLKLTARTTNTAYGTSAFSFAHVTQDPQQCLNRMDIWYCHNGDLHRVGRGGFVEVGKGRLSKADEIPLAAHWLDTVHPKKGVVYILHAKRRGHRDFHVRFRVTAVGPEAVELEWELLSLGEGAPRSIHAVQPWEASEPNMGKPGADGYAGLCGKSR